MCAGMDDSSRPPRPPQYMWNPSPMGGAGGPTGGAMGGTPMGGSLGGVGPMGGALGGGTGGSSTAPYMGGGPPGASSTMMMGGSIAMGGGGSMSMGGGSTGGSSMGVSRAQQQGLQPRGQGRAKVRNIGPCVRKPPRNNHDHVLFNPHLAPRPGDNRCTTTSRMMSTSLHCSRCRRRSPVASMPLLTVVAFFVCSDCSTH
jgi:hypothetical protein